MNSFCSNFRNFITVVNCGFKSDVIHGQAYREKKTVCAQAGSRNFLPSTGLGLGNCEVGWLRAKSLGAEGMDDLLSAAPLSVPGAPISLLVIYIESGRQEINCNFEITIMLLIVLMVAGRDP